MTQAAVRTVAAVCRWREVTFSLGLWFIPLAVVVIVGA